MLITYHESSEYDQTKRKHDSRFSNYNQRVQNVQQFMRIKMKNLNEEQHNII